MIMHYVHILLILFIVLLTVAFYTLYERNLIGLIHQRVGPNKVSFLGLLQPLLDAMNLLTNTYTPPFSSNLIPYFLAPYVSLGLSLSLWVFVIPLWSSSEEGSYSIIVFALVTSLIVFPLLVSGWASNSKYTLIGSLRSVAQSISYEVVLTTLIVLVVCLLSSYSLRSVAGFNPVILLYISPIWFFCMLAESHRAPFDFSESESELVSGYNTEYSGGLFAFVFLAEYSTLLAGCFVISLLFLPVWQGSLTIVLVPLSVLLLSTIVVVVRVTFCRYRYDLLMKSAWTSFLPLSLFLLVSFVSLGLLL